MAFLITTLRNPGIRNAHQKALVNQNGTSSKLNVATGFVERLSIFGRNSLSRRLACPVPLPWRRWVEHYLRVQVPRCVVIVVIVSSFRFSKFFEIFYEPSEPSIPSHPSRLFHRTRDCKKSFPFGSRLRCLFHNFIRSNGKSSNQSTRF